MFRGFFNNTSQSQWGRPVQSGWGNSNVLNNNLLRGSFKINKQSNLPKNIQSSICLLYDPCNYDIFNRMPRLFTITTKNSSGRFNTQLISNASKIISQSLSKNRKDLQYHLDISDDKNVITKFELLYQGQSVKFEKDEIEIAQLIVDQLKLTICPEFMLKNEQIKKKNSLTQTVFYSEKANNLNGSVNYSLKKLIERDIQRTFTIHTKKNEYKCNVFGILSSSVICDFISKNPEAEFYIYDFDDEKGEFRSICDIFNFKSVELTSDKSYAIKEIAEDLGIDCIMKPLNEFIERIEKVSELIDDQQNTIDLIDELFDYLYHIKEKTVDSVAEFILDSNWPKTDENVMELTAFLLQVIRSDIHLHPYLIELIERLNKEKEKDDNKLNTLLPFLIKRLMILTSEKIEDENKNCLIFPFIYRLYKKGLVSKELENKLILFKFTNSFFISWFFPEISKINTTIKSNSFYMPEKEEKFSSLYGFPLIFPCDPKNVDEFIKLRDKGEFEDEISIALRKDDIDTFQAIISKSSEKILKEKIRRNLFEPLFFRKNTSFLNYAAAHGSLQCFKYLLLNNQQIDDSTFEMAVIGGNNELIRIVYNENKQLNRSQVFSSLKHAIKRHQNDLFDWILEQKISVINHKDLLLKLMKKSIKNGNTHAIVQLIDNGFDFGNHVDECTKFLETASERGYYLITSFLIDLIKKNIQNISISPKSAVYFENYLIFKLFEKNFQHPEIETSLIFAIKSDSFNVIKYIFDNHISKTLILVSTNSKKFLTNSILRENNEIFDYLLDKIYNLLSISISDLFELLNESFVRNNFYACKKIADLIYSINSTTDFTNHLIKAVKLNLKEIVEYFINKKFQVSFIMVSEALSSIGKTDVSIFSFLMDNIDTIYHNKMTKCIDAAISEKNIKLVEYLLEKNTLTKSSLIEAVKTNNLQLVEMVLNKNSKPSYINKKSRFGNPLIIAAQNRNLPICKKLISIPGIDPSVYCENFNTPLIISATQLNNEIFKLIIDFYGENLKNQKWQFEKIIEILIENVSPSSYPPEKIREIINIILRLNFIDPNYRSMKNTLLNYLCDIDDIEILKEFIQKDLIDTNVYDSLTGNTPLITSVNNMNEEITKLLIEYTKTNINQRNYNDVSPLIYAVKTGQSDIVKLLLDNERFDPEESNINHALFISDLKISKILLSNQSIDVNYIPEDNLLTYEYGKLKDNQTVYKTTLIKSIINNNKEVFDLIVKYPSFDIKQHIYGALFVSIRECNFEMFKSLLSLSNEIDINVNVFNGFSLLNFVQKNLFNTKYISYIMNYPTFDSKKSNIVMAFIKDLIDSTHNNIIRMENINYLYKFDSEHDHLIDAEIEKNGYLLLSSIIDNSESFIQGCQFLLSHGVDPNMPDKNGIYPLAKAIQINSIEIASCLINSDKIDINKKIYYNKKNDSVFTTYLHLAISYDRFKVIKNILDKNGCDINILNSSGNTPMMEAAKKQFFSTIKLLFEKENLDFKHRNLNGEDAIDLAKSSSKLVDDDDDDDENQPKTEENKEINDKNAYLSELKKIIDSNKRVKSYRGFIVKSTKNKVVYGFGKQMNCGWNNSSKMNGKDELSTSKSNENEPNCGWIDLSKNEKDSSASKPNQTESKPANESDSSKSTSNDKKPIALQLNQAESKQTNESDSLKSTSNDKKPFTFQTNQTDPKQENEKEPNKVNKENSSTQNSIDKESVTIQSNQTGSKQENKNEPNNEKEKDSSVSKPNKTELKQANEVNSSASKSNNNESILNLFENKFESKNISWNSSNKKENLRQNKWNFAPNNQNKDQQQQQKQDNITKIKFTIHNESIFDKFNQDLNEIQQKSQKYDELKAEKKKQTQMKFESSVIYDIDDQKDDDDEFHEFSKKQKKLVKKKKLMRNADFLFDEDSINNDNDDKNYECLAHQNHFQDQDQMMFLQQQQQQWLQMIQVNNSLQSQINMHMMNQPQIKQHHSKKKRKQFK